MQTIENRSVVAAEIVEAEVAGDRRLRVKLCSVRPLAGYVDLLSQRAGQTIDVVIAGGDLDLHLDKGVVVEAEMSLSRPNVAVLHKLLSAPA